MQLFSGIDWSKIDRYRRNGLKSDIDSLDKVELLNTPINVLCSHLVSNQRMDIPVLNRDEIVVDPRNTKIDVSGDPSYTVSDQTQTSVTGTAFEIVVPFTGDRDVFWFKPGISLSEPPCAAIRNKTLTFQITFIDLERKKVQQEIDSRLDKIDSCLTSLRSSADKLNNELESMAHQSIAELRARLLTSQELVASLGFKLKERDDSSKTYTPPEVRRKIKPSPPQTNSEPEKLEPALGEVDYEHILGVIENMVEVMERSPAAFSDMGEEVLRSHFLVQLNGHYEGQATGETFNYEGKTDILIRSEAKNIFIAECKYWRGPKTLNETIDQLLGYTSWRDTKVAVIVFNRNKNFTRVLDSIRSTTKEHPNCKCELNQRSETSFRFIFSHPNDSNREMTLTVMAFDLPK